MNAKTEALAARVTECLGDALVAVAVDRGEVSCEVHADRLLEACTRLRDEDGLKFEMLMDVCGVDYLTYGEEEWKTTEATDTGFSRGVSRSVEGFESFFDTADEPEQREVAPGRRFAVVYHLLSISRNARLRVKAFCADNGHPMIDSVVGIWSSADWFEREAFDLFGILFRGHPDLRRLLTDYGFIGHPFRKDFPLIGQVEVRYDPERSRVVYEPVSIEPRTLVPRVIRDDNRYDPQLRDEASFREAGENA